MQLLCRPPTPTRAGEKENLPVEIVEEREEVERQLAPALLLTEGQDIGVHDGRRVVESWTAHHRSAHVPARQQGATERGEETKRVSSWQDGTVDPDWATPTSRRGRPAAGG